MLVVLKEILPRFDLTDYVRFYRIVNFEFPDHFIIPPKAYPPRPEHCLQFFPKPASLWYDNRTIMPKNAILSGQHTIVNYRMTCRKFIGVQVIFQPSALYRLLGIPMNELFNQTIEASDVLGDEVNFVNEQLCYTTEYSEIISIIEQFVIRLIKKQKKGNDPFDIVAQKILSSYQQQPLDWFVSNACVSHRQFDRKFSDRVGVGAKEFIRVARFYQAYLMKNKYPEKDWLSIALACGYYDYQHMARDYREFTGHTPVRFFSLDSPERTLGKEEVY